MQDQDTVFVPVLPSYDGFFTNLSKTAKKAGADAGRDLSDALSAGVEKSGKAADTAAAQMEKAQNRAATAAETTRQKNLALEKVLSNQNATALDLAKATDAVSKALRDQEAADKAAERAVKAHADRTQEYQRAQDQANDATRQGTSDVDAYSGSLGNMAGSLKNVVGMAAGIGTVGAAISSAMDISAATGKMNRQLGLTGETAEMMSQQVRDTMRTGMVAGADEAAEAIGALNSQWAYLGSEGEQTATELADNFLAFTKTFEVDMATATQTAGQLITNGLAPDVETAADLMTAAFQRVPAAMRDELPDLLNEYGTFFGSMGYSGEETLSMFVGMSEQGTIAMDKLGDAIKETGIRATDLGDTGAMEALEAIGLAGEDIPNRLLAGGQTARDAMEQMSQALLGVEDPAKRAEAAVSLIGTPIEDLNKAGGLDQFLTSLSGAENHMVGFEGASQSMADTMQNSLQGRMDALKGTASALASEGFMAAWDAAEKLATWARESQGWLIPVAIGVGSIAAGMAAWNATMAAGGMIAAIKNLTLVTKAQAAAQFLLNGAMWASPITWVVAGIVALVAGLTYFFTQTETGRVAWDKLTDAIATGWGWVTEKVGAGWAWLKENVIDGLTTATQKAGEIWTSVWGGVQTGWSIFTAALSAGYENYIKPIFNGLVTAAQWAALIVGTVLLTPLMLGWNLLSTAISWGYENLIKPAWDNLAALGTWLWNSVLMPVFNGIQSGWRLLGDGISWVYNNVILVAWNALQTAALWLWNSVLMPVFGWIKAGFQAVGDGISWVYNNVILVAWTALQNAATWMWTNVLMPVFGFIKSGFQALGDGILWVYDTLIKPVIDGWANILGWLWNEVVSPTLTWIGDKWSAMGDGLRAVWSWIQDNVFTPFKNGLTDLKDWFITTADNIGKGWETVKEKVKEPIQWVVTTVFNKGILPAWNSVARLVGMDDRQLEEIHFANGGTLTAGTLPGYSPGVDDYRFVDPKRGMAINLGGGESIMRPEWTRAIGGPSAVQAMNNAAKYGGVRGVQRMLGEGASFADGGVVTLGSFADGGTLAKNPNVVITSAIQRSMEAAVAAAFPNQIITSATRYEDVGSGYDNHMAGRALDFAPSQSLADWIKRTYPDSAELFWDPGPNIKNGNPTGAIGGHSDHVHWAMSSMVDPYTGEIVSQDGPGGGGGNPVASLAKRAWDAVMDVLPATPTFPGPIGEFPGAAKDFLVDTVWSFVKSKLPFGGGGGEVGAGVEQWRPLVESILVAKGFDVSAAPTVLRRMDQESSGNPSAINNWDSNASAGTPSKGLMQVIDPTFAAYKDPGFDDIWDPESNIRASMNYAIARYGSLPAAYDRAGGYDSGGWVFPGKTLVNNESGVPEAVLTGGQWAKFYQLVDSVLPGLSKEIRGMVSEMAIAYEGDDAGYGHLATVLGNRDLAHGVIEATAALGRAERGFNEWARENEDQGRIGNAQEWAAHFGGYAAQDLAADVLGLFGLEDLADITLSDPLVDLLNAAGHPASTDMFQPRDILDADNRVVKATAEAVETAVTDALTTSDSSSGSTVAGVSTSGSTMVVSIQVPEGKTALTMDEFRAVTDAITDKVGDIEIRLETVEDSQTAGPTSGIDMMV